METTYLHLPSISSTNTYAKEHKDQFDRAKMTVVYADEQTAGRGRFGHAWLSPNEGNLYATFCFHLKKTLQELTHFSLVAGVATAKFLQKYEISTKIKWPNDLFVEGKKIGGILVETSPTEEGFFVFCGIGLNINMTATSLSKIDIPATSFLNEKEKHYDVEDILHRLQQEISLALTSFIDHGSEPFLHEYEALWQFRGQVGFRN